MATSGAMSTTNQYIKYKITVTQNSQSIVNNTSNVTVSVRFYRTNTGYTTYGSGTVYCKINGTTYSASVTASQKITNSGIVLFTKTLNISHNNDGSKTLATSAWINHSQFSSSEQSYSQALTTIPRASVLDSVTCSTSYLTGTFTYKYTPKSTSFYNRLRVFIPSVVTLQRVNLGQKPTSQQTATYTLSSALLQQVYNRYPNQATAYIGIVIETYSDSGYSSKVGESSEIKINLTFPTNIVPSISNVSIAEGSDFEDHFGVFVQNKSKLNVSITATGTYGSTIKKYETYIESVLYNSSNFTSNLIRSSGTIGVRTKITDSRGRTATVTNNVTIVAYSNPTILSFFGVRCDAQGTSADDGEHVNLAINFAISPISDLNDKSYSVAYKPTSSDTWTTLISGSVYSYDSNVVTSNLFSPDYSYDIKLTIEDYFSPTEAIIQIATSFTIMDFRETGKGIAFGKASEKDAMEVAMNSEFTGQVKIFAPDSDVADSGFLRMYREDGTLAAFLATSDNGNGLNLHLYQNGAWTGVAKITPSGQVIPGTGDAVIEQGTSGVWTYRKWSSGKAECWCSITYSGAVSTAWGSLFVKDDAFPSQNYPFTFSARPVVTFGFHTNGGNFWVYTGNTQNQTYHSPSYGIARGTSYSNATAVLNLHVIGTI